VMRVARSTGRQRDFAHENYDQGEKLFMIKVEGVIECCFLDRKFPKSPRCGR
jgi:hypothetical protein